jgi:hypothetical protein
VAPHFSLEWWGLIRYGVYGSLAVCCWRELIVSRILGHNRRPWYLGYFTLTVAPEPSVEHVVKNVLLMGDIIGAYMLLQALLWDSVVRLWGLKPP